MATRTIVVEPDHVGPEFVRIFQAHVDDIRAYCRRRLPPEAANDSAADVFVVAWRRRTEMPSGAELRPWLFGVARNVVRTAQRGDRRTARLHARLSRLAAAPSSPDPESGAVEQSSRAEVRLALSKLKEDDREVLTLRAWEGLTAREIAVAMDISLSAAEKRIARALNRLRRLLGEGDGE